MVNAANCKKNKRIYRIIDFFSIFVAHYQRKRKNKVIMTKAEMVSEIAKSTGIEKVLIGEVIESFMDNIKDSLLEGENVYLRGFGSFISKARAAKVARNIARNTILIIPAHHIPAFKPAKEFLVLIQEHTK